MVELDINEVAQRSGLPASALRFYEEKGLIRSHGRRGHMQCPTCLLYTSPSPRD